MNTRWLNPPTVFPQQFGGLPQPPGILDIVRDQQHGSPLRQNGPKVWRIGIAVQGIGSGGENVSELFPGREKLTGVPDIQCGPDETADPSASAAPENDAARWESRCPTADFWGFTDDLERQMIAEGSPHGFEQIVSQSAVPRFMQKAAVRVEAVTGKFGSDLPGRDAVDQ